MAQDTTNSTIEMGTSDQILVATKKSKKLVYAIGFIAMCAVIAVVVTLAVVLTGNGGDAENIVTTEGPTLITTIPTAPTIPTVPTIPTDPTTPTVPTTPTTPTTPTVPTIPTISTTPTPLTTPTVPTTPTEPITDSTTTEPPVTTEPPPENIDLEDVINGEFASPSFNGTWVSGSEVLFRNANGDLVLYNVETSVPVTLIENSSQILQQSFRVTALSPNRKYVALSYNEASVYRHSFEALYAAIEAPNGAVINIGPPGVPVNQSILQNFVWGPTGTSLAFVYMNNIYYQPDLASAAQLVTASGVENVIYNGVPDWVYEEEVFSSNNALWFSKDGSRIAYATFNDTNVRIMKIPHFGLPGSVEYQYTSHRDIRYPKSGTNNPIVSVTLRNLTNINQRTFTAPTDLNEPILNKVEFVGNDRIAIMWTNRIQSELKVDICSEGVQSCSTIYRYSENNGWITNIPMIFNEQGNAFITILPAVVNNVRYKQILQVTNANAALWTSQSRTNTAHTVAEIISWTPENVIWYTASGIEDTAEQHLYSVNSTGYVSCFTCTILRPDGGRCLYNEASISGSRITVNCAGPDVPQIFIYNVSGSLIKVWDDNERVRNMSSTYKLPEILRRSISLGPGLSPAEVQIQVPSDYQTRTNVPLLVYVYGGPDTALVTKQWSVDWGSSLVSRYGIAVASIDGRGSSLKGVDNMFALYGRLGTVEIDDQISVTRSLHEQFPWLDNNRTCIWGWSYGGYAASVALARGGNVFRCAIAVAPVVDWRFYDTIYTERYMNTPQNNIKAYANATLLSEEVVEAYRNKSYFLVHGTEDDNVHYQHAMLFSRLLQRRDVYFHQMSYTDEDHSLIGVKPHLYHALEKFLKENMF